MIRSAERMTYTNVALVLDGDEGMRKRYAPLVERFELMEELALILAAKRERRGAIDFDLPEPVIEFDEHGLMHGVTRSERNIAHRIIEEFMLAANESVASYLENQTRRVFVPGSPEAGAQARFGIRDPGRRFWLLSWSGRFAGRALPVAQRAPRQPRHRTTDRVTWKSLRTCTSPRACTRSWPAKSKASPRSEFSLT